MLCFPSYLLDVIESIQSFNIFTYFFPVNSLNTYFPIFHKQSVFLLCICKESFHILGDSSAYDSILQFFSPCYIFAYNTVTGLDGFVVFICSFLMVTSLLIFTLKTFYIRRR